MQASNSPTAKMDPLGERFRELRNRLGLTQEQVAKRLGVTTATYNRYEKGHREPAAGLLRRLWGLAPGISAEWLLTGQGSVFAPESSEPSSALLRLPALQARAAGTDADEMARMEPHPALAFNQEWVRHELKCEPETLFLMEMPGDSMTPTLLPGELLLVHGGGGTPLQEGIHVLRLGDGIQVRRIQWLSGEELEIVPDNPLYKSRVMTHPELARRDTILGRVIWSGKRY